MSVTSSFAFGRFQEAIEVCDAQILSREMVKIAEVERDDERRAMVHRFGCLLPDAIERVFPEFTQRRGEAEGGRLECCRAII